VDWLELPYWDEAVQMLAFKRLEKHSFAAAVRKDYLMTSSHSCEFKRAAPAILRLALVITRAIVQANGVTI
jgi:hypothetical protein